MAFSAVRRGTASPPDVPLICHKVNKHLLCLSAQPQRLSTEKGLNMPDLPHPWSIYANLQTSLNDSRVRSRTWGLESALNEILGAELRSIPTTPEEIVTACSTGARRERARSLIRRRHPREFSPQQIDTVRMLEALNFLTKIKASIQPSDWRLLSTISDEVGTRGKGRTSGAVRVKVCRLRKRIRKLLRTTA